MPPAPLLSQRFRERTEEHNAFGALTQGFPRAYTWGGYPQSQKESISANYDYSNYIHQRHPGKKIIGDYRSLVYDTPQNPDLETNNNNYLLGLAMFTLLVGFFLKR